MILLAQAAESGEISLRLNLSFIDILILLIYFVWVIGIGFALKRAVTSSMDFFLSGRSLPAWITGLAFISANLGAIEILGQSASGAQYGLSVVHYYWIGALPAMVFLGIVMMPFYYGSKVRSVPEYLRLRYNSRAHLINATTFVLASLLVAGVNCSHSPRSSRRCSASPCRSPWCSRRASCSPTSSSAGSPARSTTR